MFRPINLSLVSVFDDFASLYFIGERVERVKELKQNKGLNHRSLGIDVVVNVLTLA